MHSGVNSVALVVNRPSDGGFTGSGGSSSSGGVNGFANYTVSVEQGDNGTIRVSPSRAERGDTVTITVDPGVGYELDSISVTDSSGNAVDVERQSNYEYTIKMPGRRVTVEAAFMEINEELTPEPVDLSFTDVPTSAWYYDAVRFVYEQGMMAGTGNNQFSPNVTMMRAMIVTILYRLENQPAAGSSTFTDVPAGQWYTDAVAWASGNGIVEGYGNGTFGPNDTITREQFAAMLWRYAGSPAAAADGLNYADAAETSDWALEALCWAVERSILNGKGGGVLDPQGQASRTEVAQMLKNYLN
ncbi:S-layer homology domain-containing protein [Intestinimonas butyriciproducens]|nr:S-layer homology domain-containing protein [Intestinimonas butyriciproducens]